MSTPELVALADYLTRVEEGRTGEDYGRTRHNLVQHARHLVAEVARLTRERDEARAEVVRLRTDLGRIMRAAENSLYAGPATPPEETPK